MPLDKNLIDKIIKVTSTAAISCHKFVGKNEKEKADKAATDSMRNEINKIEISGKVVIARLDDSSEATVKELVIDAGRKYLRPFNSSFPTIPINGNCTIIAVAKQVIQEL